MTNKDIEMQAQIVRKAYAKEPMSAEYEREFDKLSQMKNKKHAQEYRNARGLNPNAKTPYCDRK